MFPVLERPAFYFVSNRTFQSLVCLRTVKYRLGLLYVLSMFSLCSHTSIFHRSGHLRSIASKLNIMAQLPRHKPALLGTYKTILDDKTVPYAVKHSSRAKHVRLEVRATTGLTVVIPSSYNIDGLPALLEKRRRWILGKLSEYGGIRPLSAEKELRSGDSIPYLGRHLKVVERHNPDTAVSVRLEKNRLLVNLNHQNGRLNLVLEWWYRQQAERLIKQKADELCPRLGVTYGRLTVRGAKTRWGSCSRKANLNFNWKLMMAPETVIDYVIIHELAHLKEMNHSKDFWKLVAEHCPQWHKHRKWLKDHEAELAFKLSG